MFYDKKIKYLDYCENGERVRGGGYVKMEARDGGLRIDLTVTGLYSTDAFERDVVLLGEKKESILGKIKIASGKGTFQYVCQDIRDMGKTGISYKECRGIRISLGADREITCVWQGGKAASSKPSVVQKDETGGPEAAGLKRTAGDKREGVKETEAVKEGKAVEREEDIGEGSRKNRRNELPGKKGIYENAGNEENKLRRNEKSQEIRQISLWDKERGRRKDENGIWDSEGSGKGRNRRALQREEESRENGEENQENGWLRTENSRNGVRNSIGNTGGSSGKGRQQEKPVQLLEDKWQQLYAIYPHIRPFDDNREYISIKPADFVVFPAESYKIVNNSFLLHGYYNYRHLILAKAERKGETVYYIGVPGNFYEKEKQVAIMFGFESFECAEEPAQAGDFGYYMMRTQL